MPSSGSIMGIVTVGLLWSVSANPCPVYPVISPLGWYFISGDVIVVTRFWGLNVPVGRVDIGSEAKPCVPLSATAMTWYSAGYEAS